MSIRKYATGDITETKIEIPESQSIQATASQDAPWTDQDAQELAKEIDSDEHAG